jgi:hypothetical protein
LNNGTATLAELQAEWGVDWKESVRQRGRELKFMEEAGVPPPPQKTTPVGGADPTEAGAPAAGAKAPAAGAKVAAAFCPTGPGGGTDNSCPPAGGGGGAPGPPAKEWQEPPAPTGEKGAGPKERPRGDQSQTAIGDVGEAMAQELGFRSLLPEGQRGHKPGEVAVKGSTIDLEFDHSGRAYELKLCNSTSTEFRLKAKASEKAAKEEFARQQGKTAYTMVGVRDVQSGAVHFYAGKEPGLTGAKVSKEKFDYVGTVHPGKGKASASGSNGRHAVAGYRG